jgi:hypothetical protein
MSLRGASINYILKHFYDLCTTSPAGVTGVAKNLSCAPNLVTLNLGNTTQATNCGPDATSSPNATPIDGVQILANLQSLGVTVTTACSSPTSSQITITNVTATSFVVNWPTVGVQTYTIRVYKVTGDVLQATYTNTTSPFTITGLVTATQYDVKIYCTGLVTPLSDNCQGVKRQTTA